MKYKLFALLLAVPIAFFAADRMIASTTDGGGKEKKAPTEKVQPQATEAAQEPQAATEQVAEEGMEQASATEEAIAPAPEKVDAPVGPAPLTATELAMVDELKATIERYESGEYDEDSNDDLVWLNEDDHSKATVDFVKSKVLAPVKRVNPMGIDLDRSYSRCPSGYHVLMVSREEKPTNEGWIVADQGCWDRKIGHFRYEIASKTVEVNIGKQSGFVSLDTYLRICKKALADA